MVEQSISELPGITHFDPFSPNMQSYREAVAMNPQKLASRLNLGALLHIRVSLSELPGSTYVT